MFDTEIKTLKSLNIYLQKLVEGKLWLKVIIALFLGVGVGILLSPGIGWVPVSVSQPLGSWLALPGKLFLKLVQMIMIPLIFASIITGIASNNEEQLRKMGLGVVVYFVFTTAISITIGTIITLLIKPGNLIHQLSVQEHSKAMENTSVEGTSIPGWSDIPNAISELLPDNPLASMVTGEMLSIVIFTIIIGVAITALTKNMQRPIMTLLSAIQEICMTVVRWAMKLVPLAVFGLMAQLSSSIGVSSLTGIGLYFVVVLLGLFLLLCVYLLLVSLLGKTNPFVFLKKIRDVQLLAFSTTSSAAVMPLSLKTAEDKLKITPSVSNFIIPIGATVNMDGTAIYQCITTLFIAQAYGLEMSLLNIVLVMVTIVAASIGTPAIPGGGVVILASVLQGAGIPTEGIVIIIGVERILGMFRTAINVTGDLTACIVFDKWHNKIPEPKTN
ncbi:MAG: C4-dicarboxylate transporter [Crocinitomicaceae bacterium]|nr:C4-dicarboxylate transporter [Crocinitomicaceae bacterium]|tara:strand:+ start:44312 stop:45640 length:1329 start_codon:yes stop_codon:yes gene_type:complete